MAGTVTASVKKYKDHLSYIFDWIATSGGAVSVDIEALAQALGVLHSLQRKVLAIETIPGLLGDKATSLPSDQYDVTLLDAYGYDIADGALNNRSGTLAESVVYGTPLVIDSAITLTIANAGDTKKGRLIFKVSR